MDNVLYSNDDEDDEVFVAPAMQLKRFKVTYETPGQNDKDSDLRIGKIPQVHQYIVVQRVKCLKVSVVCPKHCLKSMMDFVLIMIHHHRRF